MRDDTVPDGLPTKFFILTYCFSWVIWLPALAAARGWTTSTFLTAAMTPILMVGAFGPFAASFFLTYREEGRAGLVRFARRSLHYHISLRTLAVCLLLFPALAALASYLNERSGGSPLVWGTSFPSLILLFVLLFFLGGSVQEEFGWAYAIDRMQNRWSPLVASILLGVIWTFWHLPLFFIPGLSQPLMPFWSFLIATVAARIIFVSVYDRTKRSILATLLCHTTFNLSLNLFPLLEHKEHSPQRAWIFFCLLIAVASLPFAWQLRPRNAD